MEAMSWARTGWMRSLAVAAVLVSGGAGCAAEEGKDQGTDTAGASEGKCAYVVEYEGRTYLDVRDRPSAGADGEAFTVGGELGTGVLPGCDESGGADGTEEPEKVTVYEVEGVDPEVAVAAGGTPEDALLVAVEGARLPTSDATS